jgi:LmbE family N-acetylglucosaminyl deacetylase
MLTPLVIVIFIVVLTWLTGFLWVTDISVPSRETCRFRRLLAIFPHPDNEAVTCGGFLHRASKSGCLVTLAILTKGERGGTHPSFEPNLKFVRSAEAQAAGSVLGLSGLRQFDLGDGQLQDKRQELEKVIYGLVEQEKPDLLITYDLAGFYGHPDHVACSEIVTRLKMTAFREVNLWYATFPRRVLALARPPDDINADPDYRLRQSAPTHKVFIGASVFPKIHSWYAYKSQRAALTKGIRRLLPIWFFMSMVLFEYFADVN